MSSTEVLLFILTSISVFCVVYTALTTVLQFTPDYAYRWHRSNIICFSLSTGILAYLILGWYSQTNFATISDVHSVSDAARITIREIVVNVGTLAVLIVVFAFASMFIGGIIAGYLGLSDDAETGIALILFIFFVILGLSELAQYLQMADQDPDAHLHLLLLITAVMGIFIIIITYVFEWLATDNPEVSFVVGLIGLFAYPVYAVGLVMNAGTVNLVNEDLFDSTGPMLWGLALGFISPLFITYRQPFRLAAENGLKMARTGLFVSIQVLTYLILLRPSEFDDSDTAIRNNKQKKDS